MKILYWILLVALLLPSCGRQAEVVSLAGEWEFRLDPDDVGVGEKWFQGALGERITLPGSLQEQGFGEDVSVQTTWTGQIVDRSWYDSPLYARYREPGNVKVPFWLNPEKHYVGVAWYGKVIDIPGSWKGRTVTVELERTHWETELYVDGVSVGKADALSTPHRYVLEGLGSGKRRLTLRVDNRVHIDVGMNAHSVSDHTQSNWNGIVGDLKISAKSAVYIDDVQVYPDAAKKQVTANISLKNTSKEAAPVTLTLEVVTPEGTVVGTPAELTIEAAAGGQTHTAVINAGEQAQLWSEHTPNVYRLRTTVSPAKGQADMRETTFGFRTFKKEGTRFVVNGQPVFLRGTLECCIFPLTGYPATDHAYWAKMYGACKDFGLNHMRFHSWCPPEAAFEVADSMGIYLQVECAAWAHIGDGAPIDEWIYRESDRILREYGNHPSFCMLVYGNEPGGANQVEFFEKLVDYWKQKDNRRVYSGAAGWPYIENADYWSTHKSMRIQGWGDGLKSIINAQSPRTDYDWREAMSTDMPTVSHEIGQWCVYPNFEEMGKYTGVLKAKNFEIFKETLEEAHLSDLAARFLYASGKLQTLCYKADIEAALRTPGFAGFQLLDLHDFPGQGTALVGILDPFWETKGYVTGPEYSRFCNQTVPLVRFPKMIWNNDETLKASVELAHFGEQPLADAKVVWTITDSQGKSFAEGSFAGETVPLGNCMEMGNIEFPLRSIDGARQLTVSVAVEGTPFQNRWNIWVYPARKNAVHSQPYIASKWDDGIPERLNKGESVLLITPKGSIRPEKGGDVSVGFSSIFWNTAWTRGQAPHTLGILCDPKHPALASFPNEGFSDYQWWDIVSNCDAMDMNDFPVDFRPIVHLIDDWFKNRKLGILFEAKAGNGKLIVCSADLQTDLANRPAAAQFRQSLLEYMASADFNPAKELEPSVIKNLFVR